MLSRKIPSTGEELPVIGLGTWQQFDVDSNDKVVPDLRIILDQMQNAGAKVIDSSPMYGKSERVVGDLTNQSQNFFYATKVWTTGRENGIRQMQDSMQKMKKEVMDLIQVHNLLDLEIHLKTLRQWKEEGLVRYIGITHYTVSHHNELEEIIKKEDLDFVQFNYSIQTRNAEKSLLARARDKGVAVIINEPLEKGSLFSRSKGKSLPAWAMDAGINNWSAFFLKYIIGHLAVNVVIPGTSNPKHMADILTAGEGEIPDDRMRQKMADFFDNL